MTKSSLILLAVIAGNSLVAHSALAQITEQPSEAIDAKVTSIKAKNVLEGQTSNKLEASLAKLKSLIADDYDFMMLTALDDVKANLQATPSLAIELEALLLEAKIKQYFGAFSEALLLNAQALDIGAQLQDPILLAHVYSAYGQLHLELEKTRLANQFYDLGLQAIGENNPAYRAHILVLKGQLHVFNGSYRQAILLYQQAETLLTADSITQIELQLAYSQAALKLGRPEDAREALEKLTPTFVAVFSSEQMLKYQLLKAQTYLQQGEFQQAIEIALEQLSITYNSRFLTIQAQLQKLLADAYLQLGEMREAYIFLNRYHLTVVALDEQKRNNKVLQLEAQLNTRLQQQQIRLLEQENTLHATQIQQQHLQQQQQQKEHEQTKKKWGFFAVLFMVFIWILYRRFITQQYLARLKSEVTKQTLELAQKNKELEQLSYSDSLTGLHNRHYFTNIIEDEIALVERAFSSTKASDAYGLSFALIDIDYFKRINDRFGHGAGDSVLKQFSTILKTVIREGDFVIRWGGEEFLIVFRHALRDDVPAIVERLRTRVAHYPFDLEQNKPLQVSCSIGLATFPFNKQEVTAFSWQQVLELADLALYGAKKSGRNAWIALDYQAQSQLSSEQLIKQGLAQAVASKAISVQSNLTQPLQF